MEAAPRQSGQNITFFDRTNLNGEERGQSDVGRGEAAAGASEEEATGLRERAVRGQRTEVGDAERRRVRVHGVPDVRRRERREVDGDEAAKAEVVRQRANQRLVLLLDAAVERDPYAVGWFRADARDEKGEEVVPTPVAEQLQRAGDRVPKEVDVPSHPLQLAPQRDELPEVAQV